MTLLFRYQKELASLEALLYCYRKTGFCGALMFKALKDLKQEPGEEVENNACFLCVKLSAKSVKPSPFHQ